MLMIRPLIRANDNRKHVAHVVVFFIFIVSNAGGSLTPLGDPPLFLGFLKGVDFFWTLKHLFPQSLFLMGSLLVIFFVLDSWYYHKREEIQVIDPTPDSRQIGFDGKVNFVLLAGVVALVLMSGLWKSDVSFNVAGTDVGLPGLVRDAGLLLIILISLKLTPTQVHADNQFGWGPMQEVAKLFAGYFSNHHSSHCHVEGGRQWPVWCCGVGRHQPRWVAQCDDVFLDLGFAQFVFRQCTHLFGIFQHSRWRCTGFDDHFGAYFGRHFCRCCFHGRQQLHR